MKKMKNDPEMLEEYDFRGGVRGKYGTQMRERKRKPVHPGRIMKNHHLIPLSLSLTDLAEILEVSRKTISKIANERSSITPDTALRLSRAFDTTPDLWLGLQQEYDLWHVRRAIFGWAFNFWHKKPHPQGLDVRQVR